jgi:hypothetical protein
VNAHEDAVSLFQRYAKGGDSETLKSWAATTLPALQHHLEMAKALNNNPRLRRQQEARRASGLFCVIARRGGRAGRD